MENTVKIESQGSRAGWDATRTCARCQARVDADAWTRLPIVEVLDRRALAAHLSVKVEWDVEVRRCSCGSLIASFRF